MNILGVDVGAPRALAVLTADGELIEVLDMPCLNGPLLAELVAKARASTAYIELVGARPEEGAVGAFAFGRSRGVIEGVLAALGVPATHIAPATWKRAIGARRD